MLSLTSIAYVPRLLRLFVDGLVVLPFLVVLAAVLVLFSRIVLTVPKHLRGLLNLQPHQPLSPDFITYRPR